MNTAFHSRGNPAVFEVPVPPNVFGQDGGQFYHYYDALAEEIDENMVSGLKEQLEGLLIFAGLFAGVNTAFLALTLPLMCPNPVDDTNALLQNNNAILLNLVLGRNDTLPSPSPLPSETFSPTAKVLTINVLFSVSLTFAIVSSFLAVLGRQWLVYYRKRTGGGPERQRWEQLKRFLGAERWRLEWVLDDFLPSLLQIGLIIFCFSLTTYLHILHPTLSNVFGALMCSGLAILIATAMFATWDKFCPFQSPLSHLIPLVISKPCVLITILFVLILGPVRLILGALQLLPRIARALRDSWLHRPSHLEPGRLDIEIDSSTIYVFSEISNKYFRSLDDGLLNFMGARTEEDDGKLQITAVKRAICTSDNAWTQVHAVSNILGIVDADLLHQLGTDYEFFFRISDLRGGSYDRTLQLCGSERTDLALSTFWLYRAAVTHINLSTASTVYQRFPLDQSGTIDDLNHSEPQLLLSSGLIQNAAPNMVAAWLGYMADSYNSYPSPARRSALGFIIDELVNPSWRCVSMVIAVVIVEWDIGNDFHKVLHAAYTGKPSIAFENLNSLVEESTRPHRRDRDTLWIYLFGILKMATAAVVADSTSGSHSSNGPNVSACLLRFSEGLIRAKHPPSAAIDVGRQLRRKLIGALLSKCEKSPGQGTDYSKSGFDEMIEELLHLFMELAGSPKPPSFQLQSSSEEAVKVLPHRCPRPPIASGRPTTSSNEDDTELLFLVSPVMQGLNVLANTLRDWGGFSSYSDDAKFRGRVKELYAMFERFEAAVEIVSRTRRRWSRDPNLDWCNYNEG